MQIMSSGSSRPRDAGVWRGSRERNRRARSGARDGSGRLYFHSFAGGGTQSHERTGFHPSQPAGDAGGERKDDRKGLAADCDSLVIDLEDAIPPSKKAEARQILRKGFLA